jgi:hypothetical protein
MIEIINTMKENNEEGEIKKPLIINMSQSIDILKSSEVTNS